MVQVTSHPGRDGQHDGEIQQKQRRPRDPKRTAIQERGQPQRAGHQQSQGVRVDQSDHTQPMKHELPGPGLAPMRKKEAPAQAREHGQPGIHTHFPGVVNQDGAQRGEPGGPEARRPIESQATDPVHERNRGDAAKRAEGATRELCGPEERHPALKQERVQRRTRRIDLFQQPQKRSGAFGPGQPHRHHLIERETALAQVNESEHRRDHQNGDQGHPRTILPAPGRSTLRRRGGIICGRDVSRHVHVLLPTRKPRPSEQQRGEVFDC
jgi:hypothetical protein